MVALHAKTDFEYTRILMSEQSENVGEKRGAVLPTRGLRKVCGEEQSNSAPYVSQFDISLEH
jgi:hypothetical protein